MTKAAYDANIGNAASFAIVLATCETDLSINNPDCYQLTAAGFASDAFGIVQANRTLGVQIKELRPGN